MGDFFKGWRRKIGVVSLVMACVFMGGWVRSFVFGDYFQWNCGCCSTNGNLLITPPDLSEIHWEWPEWSVTNVSAAEEESTLNEMPWKWRFMGFGDGEFSIFFGAKIRVILLPYWSLVIPLTLISAFLLLIKPRKSNQKNVIEPISIPAKGT